MTINITLEAHQLATILEALQALEDHHRERQHAALQARDKETARDHRSEANQAESVRSHLAEILEDRGRGLRWHKLFDALDTLEEAQRWTNSVLSMLRTQSQSDAIKADIEHLEACGQSIGQTAQLIKGISLSNEAEEITGQAAPADTPPNDIEQ